MSIESKERLGQWRNYVLITLLERNENVRVFADEENSY